MRSNAPKAAAKCSMSASVSKPAMRLSQLPVHPLPQQHQLRHLRRVLHPVLVQLPALARLTTHLPLTLDLLVALSLIRLGVDGVIRVKPVAIAVSHGINNVLPHQDVPVIANEGLGRLSLSAGDNSPASLVCTRWVPKGLLNFATINSPSAVAVSPPPLCS